MNNKYAHFFKYLLSFIPSVLVIYGNFTGGYFALGNCFFSLVVLVLFDYLSSEDNTSNPGVQSSIPNLIIISAAVFHTLSIFTLLYGIYSGILVKYWVGFAIVSTGINSGIFGITSAHELIHRKGKFLRFLGVWNLFITNYSHFYIEHRLGHHLSVGTVEDPATSRFGESFYKFLLRTIPGQYISAWNIEAKRLQRNGKKGRFLLNFVFQLTVLQTMFLMTVLVIGGSYVFLAYLSQSLIAIFLLEFVNYIEHYGLTRKKGEKIQAFHAWQSDSLTSRFTLFELSRHSDHHMKAFKPFHMLESHSSGPRLPFGYFGMFYIGLIPPIFFNLMNQRLEESKEMSLYPEKDI